MNGSPGYSCRLSDIYINTCSINQLMKVTLFNTFSDSKSVDISSLPEWKQVFINYTTWRGHYKYNNTPYACSLGLITADQYVKVSFVDRNTHIDLLGILFFFIVFYLYTYFKS